MYAIRYYKGKTVYVTGTYSKGIVSYSICEDADGNEMVLPTADLTHERGVLAGTDRIFSNAFIDDKGVVVTSEKRDMDKATSITEDESGISAIAKDGEMISKINISKEGITIGSTGKIMLDGDTHIGKTEKELQIVYAISKNGKRVKLGGLDELSESATVKRLKLTPESIVLVLDGKQKQHKGYTFEIINKNI